MSERIDTAREQLVCRGYSRNAYREQVWSAGAATTIEQWVHPVGPAVLFTHDGNGWELYVQADTTNEIDATWGSLDSQIQDAERIKHHAERTFDCEIWIGAIVGTPGMPQSGDKWVPAEYIATNEGGQHYVSPRSSSTPFYVAESAFRRTKKVGEKELREVGR